MKLFILIWWQASICFSFRDESSLKKKCPTLSFLLLLTPPNFNLLNQGFHPSQLLKISPNLCKYIFYWSSAYKTLPFFTRVNHSYLTPRYVTISNWAKLFQAHFKNGIFFYGKSFELKERPILKNIPMYPQDHNLRICTVHFLGCILVRKGGKRVILVELERAYRQ